MAGAETETEIHTCTAHLCPSHHAANGPRVASSLPRLAWVEYVDVRVEFCTII